MTSIDSPPEERAARRADDLTGLYWHLAVYVVINAFLWALLSGASEFIAALLGWAVLANSFAGNLYGFLFGLVTGMMVSKLAFDSMGRWLVFFVSWMLLDYLDHLVLGENGSVAMYIGQHMISWGLIGQLQLAFQILMRGSVRY